MGGFSLSDYRAKRCAQALRTREAILKAAVTLSKEKGFDAMTVRDVCRRAGITTGAFYHHFSSKDDLLYNGFATLDLHIRQTLEGHGGDAPDERLRLILSAYVAFMEDLGWETVARYYAMRISHPAGEASDQHRFVHTAVLGCLLEACGGKDVAPGFSPAWTADFILRHFRGAVIDWVLCRGGYSLSQRLAQDCRLLQSAFLP
ncbi:MAG TPA: TetR/AcrR family transcriptional regulator [Candidatus Ruthenibacterium merdigallinarum]|nr:TetR/AcrR family transcriptional regulator [Candidatus Ruthenibacterium merdigallinarum]